MVRTARFESGTMIDLPLGLHLATRDGHVCGNAVLIRIKESNGAKLYTYETDFGSIGCNLTRAELETRFHLVNKLGVMRVHDVSKWREDRASNIAFNNVTWTIPN